MATKDKILSINLNKGMDTKLDDRLEAECELIQNATIDKTGTPRKRNGFELYLDTEKRIKNSGSLNNSLIIECADGTYSVSKQTGTLRKIGPNFCHLNGIDGVNKKLLDTSVPITNELSNGFVYTLNGYTLVGVNTAAPASILYVLDEAGNDVTQTMSWYGTLGYYGNIAPCWTVNQDKAYSLGLFGGNLSLSIFNPITTLTQVTVQAAPGTVPWDIFNSKSGRVFCIYVSGTDIKVKEYNSAGALFLDHTITSTTDLDNTKKITGYYDDSTDSLVICYQSTSDELKMVNLKYDLSYSRRALIFSFSTADKYLTDFTIASYNGTVSLFTSHQDETNLSGIGDTVKNFCWCISFALSSWSGSAWTTSTEQLEGLIIESKAFLSNGIAYIIAATFRYYNTVVGAYSSSFKDDQINNAYVFLNQYLETSGHAGKGDILTKFTTSLALDTITVQSEINNRLMYPISSGDDVYFLGNFDGFLKKINLDFFKLNCTKFYEYNNKLILTSSLNSFYDGNKIAPLFSIVAPKIVYSGQINGSGSLPNGTFLVCCTFVIKGMDGQEYESEKSNIVTITVAGANDTIELILFSPGPMTGYGEGKIRLYRTVDADTNFLLDSEVELGVGGLVSLTKSDANLGDFAYFNGDIIENSAPPPSSSSCIYKNRLFFVSDENNALYFSKNPEFGSRVNVGFSEDLVTGVYDTKQDNIGKVRCVESQDDKLLIFKDSGVYYLFGDGPDNDGEGNIYSLPQMINSEVGCDNSRSIIQTNIGTMFKSKKGIYIIDRSMGASYIGAQMESYNESLITSSIFKEKRNLAIFTLYDGPALVFNTADGKWSVFTNYSCNNLCFHKDEINIFKETGEIYIENSSFSDNGSFIPLKLELGWIRLAEPAIQNFQRVKRFILLGKWKSKHKLKFSMSYDYEDYIEEAVTYTPNGTYNITSRPANTSLHNGTNNGVYQVEHVLKKQKCQAIKITIEDVQDVTIGESLELTNLSLIIGTKSGMNKVNKFKKV